MTTGEHAAQRAVVGIETSTALCVGRPSVAGPEDFKTKVIGALRRLQKLPRIVRAFFADPDLHYITA